MLHLNTQKILEYIFRNRPHILICCKLLVSNQRSLTENLPASCCVRLLLRDLSQTVCLFVLLSLANSKVQASHFGKRTDPPGPFKKIPV